MDLMLVELNELVVGQLLPHILGSKLTQLQMEDLILSTINKLKNRIGLGKSMKCGE